MSNETVAADAAPAESTEKNANLAASVLLRDLGYNVDAAGPLYFLALAKFLQAASVEERKQAETPEGLLLVLHRRLDAKKNKEAEKSGPNLKVIAGLGIGALLLMWLTHRNER